jgi:hypothetical protein
MLAIQSLKKEGNFMFSYHKSAKFIVLVVLFTPVQAVNDASLVHTSSPDYTMEAKFTALYIKPGASNTHFAAQAFPLPAVSPNWQIHDIEKAYHFGFDAMLGTHIHCVDGSLFANWQHFKNCNRTVFVTTSNNMLGPFFEIGPDASPFFQAIGTVHFKFNEINVDYGQNIKFGDRLTTTFFAGCSVLQLCELFSYDYIGTQYGTNVVRNITTPIKFTGAGPQFGVSFFYDIMHGFGLSGKLSGAILNGSSYNNTTYTSTSPILVTLGVSNPNVQTTKVNRISLTVPSLFSKIGFMYQYDFAQHYAVQLEAGYQAQIYLQALQSIDMGSEVVTPPVESSAVGVYARTFQRHFSSFSLSGAYFTFGLCF